MAIGVLLINALKSEEKIYMPKMIGNITFLARMLGDDIIQKNLKIKRNKMRLDHVAYRCASRRDAVEFFKEAFGYSEQAEFEIFFDKEKKEKAICTALEPPEKTDKRMPFSIQHISSVGSGVYHMPPEIFVSEGSPGSIVWKWVQARGGIGGIHHMAYEVESVEKQRDLWISKGWGDFTSKDPFKCDDLTQIFTKPHRITGMIYEFIERKGAGFCSENVLELMKSTANLDANIK